MRELIQRPVKDFPDIYSDEAVDEIIRVTQCQPYYIQLLCALLVERMNRAHRMPPDSCVATEDVIDIIPLALERGQNYFSDLWQNQIGSDAGRRILEHLAKSPDLSLPLSDVHALVPDDVARRAAIDTLKRREIIDITDGGCRIIVPLVAGRPAEDAVSAWGWVIRVIFELSYAISTLCRHARMLLSGIHADHWRVTLIEPLDSRLKRAGTTIP